MTSRIATDINKQIRNRDALVFLGTLSDATAVRERVQAEAVTCPHCSKNVHPSRLDEHMALDHRDVLLSDDEKAALARLETRIERGLAVYYELGEALQLVRDNRLYRESYQTFAAYCRQRWNLSKSHVNRMIRAAAVRINVAPIGVSPENETQARPMAALEPEAQRIVWEVVQQTAPDGKVTGQHVQSVANVFKEVVTTQAIDGGEGVSIRVADIVKAAVTEETYERMARQKEHITRNSKRERVLSATASVTISKLNAEGDTELVTLRLPAGTDTAELHKAWRIGKPVYVNLYTEKDAS